MVDNITEILKKKKTNQEVGATLIFELIQRVLLNGINEDLQQIITLLNLHLEIKKTLFANKKQKKSTNEWMIIVQKGPNKKMKGILTEVKMN